MEQAFNLQTVFNENDEIDDLIGFYAFDENDEEAESWQPDLTELLN